MKIILSPSKTQDFTKTIDREIQTPYFEDAAISLAHKIRRMSKKYLGETMKIKSDLLEETYANYKSYDEATPHHAIYTYTGLVYKYMNIFDYNETMLTYLDTHLCILSALYGVLKPFDGIKPYRLDMKMPIMKESLYSYWRGNMGTYFESETILNLASEEFSKMIPLPMITIGFRDYKDDKYKNIATHSKMARGMLLDYMIKYQVTDIDTLRTVTFNGYHYNNTLSDDSNIIFSKIIS